jgi:hypothetical protein
MHLVSEMLQIPAETYTYTKMYSCVEGLVSFDFVLYEFHLRQKVTQLG